jgi:hypothetical protein
VNFQDLSILNVIFLELSHVYLRVHRTDTFNKPKILFFNVVTFHDLFSGLVTNCCYGVGSFCNIEFRGSVRKFGDVVGQGVQIQLAEPRFIETNAGLVMAVFDGRHLSQVVQVVPFLDIFFHYDLINN